MIDIIEYEDGLPVSIIVPHGESTTRNKFFDTMVLPMLEANQVREIIINTNPGGAPKKRNEGFKKSTQPFVIFCDNDIVFPSDYIEKLYNKLQENPHKSYAYTGYQGIVLKNKNHPVGQNFQIPTRTFNDILLRQSNYISTMSLVRREHFPMFDENLKRLQDWDVWLTMLQNGHEGIEVADLEFYAYYLDEGITSNNNSEQDALTAIIRKHNLGR